MFRKSSVSIARDRLKNLLASDRMRILPESSDVIRNELYRVLSRYIEITKDDFKIEIYRTHIIIRFTGEDL